MAERELSRNIHRSAGTPGWLSRAGGLFQRRVDVPAHPSIPAELRPGSRLLEACRTLRANLSPGQVGPLPPLLLVGTASDPGLARVSSGLAVVFAEEERSTLLVDANLRRPTVHTLFSLDLSPGLANALESGDGEADAARLSPNLWVLPAGRSRRSPAELLRLPAAERLTRELAGRFEAIVYHAPGDWEHPDALLLAAHVRSAVLLIVAGSDPADRVRRAKELLERAGVDILGFTLLDERA